VDPVVATVEVHDSQEEKEKFLHDTLRLVADAIIISTLQSQYGETLPGSTQNI